MQNLKMPDYDFRKNYDTEFYNLFIQNQHLLEQVENEASERNDILTQIYRITDFYDNNVAKMKAERYQSGRKIHERKKMSELERGFQCPYDSCGKQYASEGAVNLHIKIKHNGGNKTEREKLAKSLVYCKAKGFEIPEKLDVNLPPGIVQKAAMAISTQIDVEIKDDDLKHLECKLKKHNKKNAKQMKALELMKAKEETDKAI